MDWSLLFKTELIHKNQTDYFWYMYVFGLSQYSSQNVFKV